MAVPQGGSSPCPAPEPLKQRPSRSRPDRRAAGVQEPWPSPLLVGVQASSKPNTSSMPASSARAIRKATSRDGEYLLASMAWLVDGAVPGCSLFFHYSGHGGQVADKDGDEEDGFDETILPCDYSTAGQLTDDKLFSIMIQPLPAGARFTSVMDCCRIDVPALFSVPPASGHQVSCHAVAEGRI